MHSGRKLSSLDTAGMLGYLLAVGLSLLVQRIDEGWSVWTAFKLGGDAGVLAIALWLVAGQPMPTPLRQVASWVVLLAVPWLVSLTVEPALVFSLDAETFRLSPHIAFHLLMLGGYVLALTTLLAFLAMGPLRRGESWCIWSLLLLAVLALSTDLVATSLIYQDLAHTLGHLLSPVLVLIGVGLLTLER
ncbi:MAG: hypothetical protein HYY30_04855 [Chloroflexi bacterium]|nr:hypothetical protein [Chloroflexota bacterium]